MYKRIIAITAALSMIFGSALIPAADTGGEPVRQVTDKLNKTVKTELRNLKTEISTTELTYGPIRPVEVKEETNDTRRDNGDMYEPVERILGGNETDNNGDSSGGEPAGQLPDPAGDPEPSGDVLEGTAGADPEPEQAPEEEFGASGDDYEEAGEDSGEDVEPEPEPVVEEPQMEYLGDWTISFYCNCSECCGQWAGGATASGAMPSAWWTAATSGLDFGTIVYVDGLGTFEIQDRGTDYGWLDVFVSDHSEALANGLQTRSVYIVR